MCRLVGYLGEKIPLRDLIFKPKHNIYIQAWQPKELTYAKLNADGFGFGWHTGDGASLIYRSHLPIWSDINLESLAESLLSPSWMVMVRSATGNYPSSPFNVQPFKWEKYLFMHNGYIERFNEDILPNIALELSPDVARNVQGLTDSEYLFGLFLQRLADNGNGNAGDALLDVIRWCEKHASDRRAMLNILVSDGASLFAVKYAINQTPPSLYFVNGDYADLPEQTQLIASEKFSEDDCWQTVPDNGFLTMTLKQPIVMSSL